MFVCHDMSCESSEFFFHLDFVDLRYFLTIQEQRVALAVPSPPSPRSPSEILEPRRPRRPRPRQRPQRPGYVLNLSRSQQIAADRSKMFLSPNVDQNSPLYSNVLKIFILKIFKGHMNWARHAFCLRDFRAL